MQLLPYSQFTNIQKIGEGGFGIIYKAKATWSYEHKYTLGYKRQNEDVILKRFRNSRDISKDFLNELQSHQHCYKTKHHIIKPYGFTKDPELEDYLFVMEYASEGDLHNYLQKKFTEITWKKKLLILWQISEGYLILKTSIYYQFNFFHND
ncbi:kinase-like domain-containing protein [Glomus cerebriforme]|uniref:Kinase-like domain-containing protein n=1 Tax=Glomus cerebriforme TaxID=658196 RepID=A0A397SWQ4_9GLOM|nr:kinase-like domain-containing protein [Glomus cerebriforme]